MATKKPCAVTLAPLNSGPDCQIAMGAPCMILMVPATDKWNDSDEVDFLAYIETRIHDVPNKRWIPLFGLQVPIRTINDGKETDVTVTYDDGSMAFIRNGMLTRTMLTNKGGLANAQTLVSFNRFKRYAFIEVDKNNNILRKRNADGTLSGVKVNAAYGVTPDLAGLKTEFLSGFCMNFSVEEYIQSGEIVYSDQELRDLTGLINVEPTDATGSSTTKLKFGLRTIGSQTDLVALYPQLASLTTVSVTKKSDGSVNTAASAAVVSGHIELTGTYTSGSVYIIAATTPAALKALTPSVTGYEITKTVEITIP